MHVMQWYSKILFITLPSSFTQIVIILIFMYVIHEASSFELHRGYQSTRRGSI
jgi:hypothetical protein